jgi:phospholipase A-2-activating protein
VGTVVDAVGSSGKKVDYLGKEYDYVFDVDIEDGKPALKLPYNLSQNPYEAATKFINDNELPITYLDQVSNFITTNTQGATIGSQHEAISAPDAWGSDNRYRPGDEAAARTSTGAPPRIIPQTEYLSILAARVAAMQKKIVELNQALIRDGHKDVSLNPAELSALASVCEKLGEANEATTLKNIPDGLQLAVKLATAWPYKDRLPGLDLLRLLATTSEMASYSHRAGSVIDVLISAASENSSPSENHVMMAVRAFVNLFSSNGGRVLAAKQFEDIQTFITGHLANTSNRNLLVAVSTVYINYAVYFATVPDSTSFEHVIAIYDTLSKLLTTQSDSEVIYRALVATGTLLTLDEDSKNAAKEVYDIKGAVDKALSKASDPRVKNVGKEIGLLLR